MLYIVLAEPGSFASKVTNCAWIQSVPSRGSGWVNDQVYEILAIEHVYDVPIRDRGTVLTVSKPDVPLLRQAEPVRSEPEESVLFRAEVSTVIRTPKMECRVSGKLVDSRR